MTDKDRHPGYGIPSNAHYRRHAWQEPDRTEPRPLSRADVRDALILLPVAVLVIVGLIVGIGYFLVTLGPDR